MAISDDNTELAVADLMHRVWKLFHGLIAAHREYSGSFGLVTL